MSDFYDSLNKAKNRNKNQQTVQTTNTTTPKPSAEPTTEFRQSLNQAKSKPVVASQTSLPKPNLTTKPLPVANPMDSVKELANAPFSQRYREREQMKQQKQTAVNTGKAFSPEVVQYLDDSTKKKLTEGKPFWDNETKSKYNVLSKKEKEAYDVQAQLYDYMNNMFKSNKNNIKSALQYSEDRADRKRKQTIREKNNDFGFIDKYPVPTWILPDPLFELTKGAQAGITANLTQLGEDKELMKARNESPWYSPYNIGKIGGSMIPIGFGGQVIGKGLAKVLPKAFGSVAGETAKQAAARRIANTLTADTIAGVGYGVTEETLDAALDTRKDGAQTFAERAKKVGTDAALGLGIGVGVEAIGLGLSRIKTIRDTKKRVAEAQKFIEGATKELNEANRKIAILNKADGTIGLNDVKRRQLGELELKREELGWQIDEARKIANPKEVVEPTPTAPIPTRTSADAPPARVVPERASTTSSDTPAPTKEYEDAVRQANELINNVRNLRIDTYSRKEMADAQKVADDVTVQLQNVNRRIALLNVQDRRSGLNDAKRTELQELQSVQQQLTNQLEQAQMVSKGGNMDDVVALRQFVNEHQDLYTGDFNFAERQPTRKELPDIARNILMNRDGLIEKFMETGRQQQKTTLAGRLANVLKQQEDAKRTAQTNEYSDFWQTADLENPQQNPRVAEREQARADEAARAELPYPDVPTSRDGRIEYVIDNAVDYVNNSVKKSERVTADANAKLEELQTTRRELVSEKEAYLKDAANVERAIREYEDWVKFVQTVNALTREGKGIKLGRGQKVPSSVKRGSIPIQSVADNLGISVDELIAKLNVYQKMVSMSVKKQTTLAKKKRRMAVLKLSQEQAYKDIQTRIEQVDELIAAVEDIKPQTYEYQSRPQIEIDPDYDPNFDPFDTLGEITVYPKENEMFSGYLIEKWYPESAEKYREVEEQIELLEKQIEEQEKLIEEFRDVVLDEFKILSEARSDADTLARMLVNFVRGSGRPIHWYSSEEDYWIYRRKGRQSQTISNLPAWTKGIIQLKPSRKYRKGKQRTQSKDNFLDYVRENLFDEGDRTGLSGRTDEAGDLSDTSVIDNTEELLYRALEGNPYKSIASDSEIESRLTDLLQQEGKNNPRTIIADLERQIDDLRANLVEQSRNVIDNRLDSIGELPDSEIVSMVRDVKGEQTDFEELLTDYMNEMYPDRVVPDIEPIRLETPAQPAPAKAQSAPRQTTQAPATPTNELPVNVPNQTVQPAFNNIPSRNTQTPSEAQNTAQNKGGQTNTRTPFEYEPKGDEVEIVKNTIRQSFAELEANVASYNPKDVIYKFYSSKNLLEPDGTIRQALIERFNSVYELWTKDGKYIPVFKNNEWDKEVAEEFGWKPPKKNDVQTEGNVVQFPSRTKAQNTGVQTPQETVAQKPMDAPESENVLDGVEYYGFRSERFKNSYEPEDEMFDAVRISLLQDNISEANFIRFAEDFYRKNGRKPTIDEVVNAYKIDKEVEKIAQERDSIGQRASQIEEELNTQSDILSDEQIQQRLDEYDSLLNRIVELKQRLFELQDLEKQNNSSVKNAPNKNSTLNEVPFLGDDYFADINAPINQPDFAENLRQEGVDMTGDYLPDIPVDERLERGFNRTARTSPNTPEPLREEVQKETDANEAADLADNPSWYAQKPNVVLVNKAIAEINKRGEDEVYEEILKRTFITDILNAQAQVLIKRFIQQGKLRQAMQLIAKVSKIGTELGRAVQAFSLYNKLDVDGVILMAQRALDKRNKRNEKSGEQLELSDIDEQVQTLLQVVQKIPLIDEVRKLALQVQDLIPKKATAELTPDEANLLKQFEDAVKKLSDQFPKPPTPKEVIEAVSEIEPRLRKRDEFIKYMEVKAEEARKRLNKNRNRLSSTPFDQWKDYVIIGASYFAKGVIKFSDFSEQMIKAHGEKMKPYMNKLYMAALKLYRKERGLPSTEKLETSVKRALNQNKIDEETADNIMRMAMEVGYFSDEFRVELLGELQKGLRNIEGTSFWRKVATVQTIVQLLNPKTLIRNALGNEMFWRLEQINKLGAVGIDFIRSKWTGNERNLYFFTNNQESYFKNFMIGAKAGWKGYSPDGLNTAYDLDAQVFTNPKNPFYWLEKALGVTLRSFDYAGYKRAYGSVVGEWATSVARREGLSGAALKARVKELAKNADDEITAIADEYGRYVTFQDDTILAQSFQKAKQALNLGKDFGLGDLIIKYPTTPANLLMRAIDYSPVGIWRGFMEIGKARSGKDYDPRLLANSLSRGFTGVGITSLAVLLAELGVLTGSADKDADIRELEKSSGMLPYAVNVDALFRYADSFDREQAKRREGDRFMTYDWMQPMAVSVAMGVTTDRLLNEKDAKTNLTNRLYDLTDAGLTTFMEQPLISGVSNLFKTYPDQSFLDKLIGGPVGGLPSSFIPTLSGQFRQLADNNKRLTFDNKNLAAQSANKALDRIPFASKTLPIAYDAFGKPIERYQGGSNTPFNVFLNPSFVSKYKPLPEAKTALELYERTNNKVVAPRVPRKELEDFQGVSGKLSKEQLSELTKTIGQRQSGWLKYYDEVLRNPNIPDAYKIEIYKKILDNANEEARNIFRVQTNYKASP